MNFASEYFHHNGAHLWFKVAGPEELRPVIYLHGGPGHSSYSFQRTVGPKLENDLRMVYFDQRQCGRSKQFDADAPLTVEALVGDIEALRSILQTEKVHLMGHSFGGLLALEYSRRFPQRVDKMILIDISANLPAMAENQIQHVARVSSQKFPEGQSALKAIASSPLDPIVKMKSMYEIVDAFALQRELFWYDEEAMHKNAALDHASNLFVDVSELVPALEMSGYLASNHSELMQKIPHSTVLFAGEHSHCVGYDNIKAAAAAWDVPIVWFKKSGHLPQIEEPDIFSAATVQFFVR